MCTVTTKIREDSRIVHVAIDVNAKPNAAVKLDQHLAAALSFGGFSLMDATAYSFSFVSFAC